MNTESKVKIIYLRPSLLQNILIIIYLYMYHERRSKKFFLNLFHLNFTKKKVKLKSFFSFVDIPCFINGSP